MPQLRRTILCGFLASSTACYQYHPLPSDLHSAAPDVRISLTDRGSVELASLIGPQITKVEGNLTEAGDTAFVVHVSRVVNRSGYSTPWSGESLRIPRDYASSIERKELSQSRSWLVGGLSLAAVALIGLTVSLTGSTTGSGKGPTGGSK
ncbi:MAG: hypothetical protein ABIT38_09760 [Gemmatimonadaceae bacterium]